MQPDSHGDLDQTDELPRLDVAAYEAGLVHAGEDPLSRTDTWAVAALQELDLPDESQAPDAASPVRSRGQKPVISGSADLTINVDRLLKRITELETGSAAVRTANVELERRNQSLSDEHARLAQRLNALQAENARLTEHSSISHERAQRFEQASAVLEERVAQNVARIAELENAQARLQDAMDESVELAESRAAMIVELQRSLAEEEDAAHGLGRNLAAKLADLDLLSSLVTQRNATILSLQHARDELEQQLQQTIANSDALARQLADANQRVAEHSRQFGERDREIAALRDSLTEAQTRAAGLQGDLAAALAARDEHAARTTQLLTAKNAEIAALQVSLEEQQPLIRSLEQSLHARDTLAEDLRNEVRTVQDERAIMAGQLDRVRQRAKAMAQQIFQKDSRIATLKADLAVHTEALAAIRRDINRVEGGPEELAEDHSERVLEPVDHEGDPIVLNRRVMTIGRTNDNDIFIPSKMISRHHARLLIGPNAVIVEDAGSTNGCYVNDHQVKQHVLREGDVLAIGDLKFRLVISAPGETRQRTNVIAFNEGRRGSD